MICAFTGHRPHHLPWGSREEDPRCLALKELMARAIQEAAARGAHTFLCGMARGCDMYFAEAVLASPGGLRLEGILPCPEQAEGWAPGDQARYGAVLQRCAAVEMTEPVYSPGCMLRRNRRMVDRADLLITVFDGSSGGTASTIAYAKSKGVELLPLWL